MFYDICYEILSHYLHFPDVANTFKSIGDGINHQNNFLQDYQTKRNEIISYIIKARTDNIIYTYREKQHPIIVSSSPARPLSQANENELYAELSDAILLLIAKGIHQIIKLSNQNADDAALSSQLIQQDISVLQENGLYNQYGGM